MKKFPKLYSKTTKGAIQEWQVWADNGRVYTAYGQKGGAVQFSEYEAVPKNIGKINATDITKQAELEAESLWKEKLRKKYFTSLAEVEKPLIRPMLAKVYDGKKLNSSWLYQPKLDGIRCLGMNTPTGPTLVSRTGKLFDIPHINHIVKLIHDPSIVIDGEIYIHGSNLQHINSLVRKTRKDFDSDEAYWFYKEPLQYHVYDLIDLKNLNTTFVDRFEKLKNIVIKIQNEYPVGASLKLVDTNNVDHSKELPIELYENLGYEGLILRNGYGKYKLGARSDDLLKYKRFQDDEFEVVGYDSGKGKFENFVIWKCVTKDGKEFSVTPKGTEFERSEMLMEADQYIGKKLTVKYINYTPDGIPFHPVGICFREF